MSNDGASVPSAGSLFHRVGAIKEMEWAWLVLSGLHEVVEQTIDGSMKTIKDISGHLRKWVKECATINLLAFGRWSIKSENTWKLIHYMNCYRKCNTVHLLSKNMNILGSLNFSVG